MIVIVDYGMGNLGSIENMLKRIGAPATISGDPAVVATADKVILPGVGAFDTAMRQIDARGLRPALERKAFQDRVPVLGICLGMQLLTESSEEGLLPGLGWIPATTQRFPTMDGYKVPHMGWNVVTPQGASPLTAGMAGEETRFYFVHSYFVRARNAEHSILGASHGVEFDAGIQSDNIFGVQFHPEKSHRFGLRLLTNFVEL